MRSDDTFWYYLVIFLCLETDGQWTYQLSRYLDSHYDLGFYLMSILRCLLFHTCESITKYDRDLNIEEAVCRIAF